MVKPEGQAVASQSKARDRGLLGCDEFQQSWHSFLRCGDPTLDRRDNVLWLFDPFAVATKSTRHGSVVAGDVGASILLCADRHHLQLDGHGEVVQKDGQKGMRSRTAVSKSIPVKPIAASPQTLMQSLSGAASFAPIASPSP